MARSDTKYGKLKKELDDLGSEAPHDVRATKEAQLKEREKYLASMYHQVAVQFADAHDTPERMQEVGCIQVPIYPDFYSTRFLEIS